MTETKKLKEIENNRFNELATICHYSEGEPVCRQRTGLSKEDQFEINRQAVCITVFS